MVPSAVTTASAYRWRETGRPAGAKGCGSSSCRRSRRRGRRVPRPARGVLRGRRERGVDRSLEAHRKDDDLQGQEGRPGPLPAPPRPLPARQKHALPAGRPAQPAPAKARACGSSPRPRSRTTRGCCGCARTPARALADVSRPPGRPVARAHRRQTRSGTDEQRASSSKALGSPDFAFLEGPPGSGKTTAICEIVQQLVDEGAAGAALRVHPRRHRQRARALARLGLADRRGADRQARQGGRQGPGTQLDERVEALVAAWRGASRRWQVRGRRAAEMAERTVIMAANLTCGTTMGIVNHPLFRGRDEDMQVSERPITTMPHWDVLIVDEASKTLIQEFMVPALMARRWIIVGDVRQLPPFADRADIVANLRDLVDDKDRPMFPRDHQRACLLLFRLLQREDMRQTGDALAARRAPGRARVDRARAGGRAGDPTCPWFVSSRHGGPTAGRGHGHRSSARGRRARGAAARRGRLGARRRRPHREGSRLLPANLLLTRGPVTGSGQAPPEATCSCCRQAWWLGAERPLPGPYGEEVQGGGPVARSPTPRPASIDWLRRARPGQELAWRLTRLHELRHRKKRARARRLARRGCRTHVAGRGRHRGVIAEIEDIGLPSILEVLQEGIGVDRSKRRSALTAGMRRRRDDRRSSPLREPQLSAPHAPADRRLLARGHLRGQVPQGREHDPDPRRRARLGLRATSGRAGSGRTSTGTRAGRREPRRGPRRGGLLREFIDWARRRARPSAMRPGVGGRVPVLLRQAGARAVEMLRTSPATTARRGSCVRGAPVEIVCGTVDRFQGREADLVMLSMRNTRRSASSTARTDSTSP
jgi:hypothetical protein